MKNTLKRILATVLVFTLVCSLSIAPAHATESQHTITLNLSGQWYGNASMYGVAVSASTSDNKPFTISSGQVVLKFDNSVLEYVEAEGGDIPKVTETSATGKVTEYQMAVDSTVASNMSADQDFVIVSFLSTKSHTVESGTTLATVLFSVRTGTEKCSTKFSFSEENLNGQTQKSIISDSGISAGFSYELDTSNTHTWDNVPGELPTINKVELVKSDSDSSAVSTVNVEGGTSATQTVQAKAYSAKTPNPTDITTGVTWSVSPTGKGVSINATTGEITVDPKAAAGDYTITATAKNGASQGAAKTAKLTVTRAASVVTDIELNPRSVQVDGKTDAAITATAKDQFGDAMEAAFSVNPADKVTVSGNAITVGAKAAEGTYTVKAGADSPSATFEVKRTTQKAETITITGGNTELTVPSDDNAATATFGTTMKDQYDAEYTGTVTWTASSATGVSIDQSGKLTVTKDAKAYATDTNGKTVTVTATCDGKSATKEITIKRAAAQATKVKLFRNDAELNATDTVVMPVSGGTDKTYTYTAKLYDQYGAEMTGATSWNTPTISDTNVTFSNGTLTVKDGAAKGTEVTLEATISDQKASVKVTITDVDVNWSAVDSALKTGGITYGDKNSTAFTSLPGTGTATAAGASLAGTFSVKDGDATQAAGNQKVTVVFKVTTAGEYLNVEVTKDYEVTVAKKAVTVTADNKSRAYGEANPELTFTVPNGALVGEDTNDALGVTLNCTATVASPAGTPVEITGTSNAANYDVTVTKGTLTITKANISGFNETAPAVAEILANNEKNTAEGLKTVVTLPATVTVKYGDNKTESNVTMNWAMSPTTVNPKGGIYTFTGTPDLGTNFTNTGNQKLTTTVTVKAVTGTASIETTASTKAFAAVTGASDWSALGMPTQVTVTYDNSVTDGPYNITDWTPNLTSLKGQATGTADKTVKLTPVVTYPAWATISNTPEFTMMLTPKYPVKVTVTAPDNITYGTALGDPSASQEAIDNGTDDTANVTYTYTYEGTGNTTYGPSETKPVNAGSYTVTASLVSTTHSGTSEPAAFTISPKALVADAVTLELPDGGYTYDKTAKTPAVTVTDGETVLAAGTDYTVEYTDNTDAGTATVTAAGKGNYSGTASTTFEIAKASIADMVPVISGTPEAGYVLTASLDGVAADELTWTWNVGETTTTAVSYTIQPTDSNKSITATATAKETGNYTGTSAASAAVTVAKVAITGTVTIGLTTDANSDGKISAGDTVAATVAVQPDGVALDYYWNGSDVAGSATYTVADGDTTITVTVKPNTEDYEGAVTSAAVEVGKSVLSGTVNVTGGTTVGTELTAVLTGGPESITADDYIITWLRNGEVVGTGATYTVAKADQGTTITAKVTAAGETYTGELVSNNTSIPAAVPDTPSVTATAGNGQVTVTWTTPDGNGAPVTGYMVSDGTNSVTLPVGSNTHTFTGLTNGTAYTFTVKATNSVGDSTAGTATATPVAPVEPEEPGTDIPYIPPIFDGTGTGTGGSGSGSGSTTTTTPTDPDQPTTTTTTDRDGNVTTTTTYPDGSTTTTEEKTDGTTIVTDVDGQGNSTSTVSNPDGSSMTTVQNVDGSSSIVSTDASGKTSAIVDLPAETVNAANSSNTAASLPMQDVTATRDRETAPVVVVNTENEQPVKVEIPVSNVTTGTVAVLVKADGTEEIIKTTIPTQDGIAVTLNSGDTVKIVDNSQMFSDTRTHWGSDAVNFVASRELFNGTSGTAFSPDESMTRGMLMTVLARFENVDTTGGSTWYEKGVAWAVTQGLSDGTNPNGEITREQLATIIYRYAQSKGVNTRTNGSLAGYPDAGKVSDWAKEAMSWAVSEGIITGVGGSILDPGGSATRAQVATIIMRYAEKFAA